MVLLRDFCSGRYKEAEIGKRVGTKMGLRHSEGTGWATTMGLFQSGRALGHEPSFWVPLFAFPFFLNTTHFLVHQLKFIKPLFFSRLGTTSYISAFAIFNLQTLTLALPQPPPSPPLLPLPPLPLSPWGGVVGRVLKEVAGSGRCAKDGGNTGWVGLGVASVVG